MAAVFTPGSATFYATDSPVSSFSGIFEDDGETGYFYAYDRAAPGHARILDACHIYNVASVLERDRPSEVEIIWTADGMKAALLLNGRAHAVADYAARRAYCRTNFPQPVRPWRAEARAPWDDALMAEFYRLGPDVATSPIDAHMARHRFELSRRASNSPCQSVHQFPRVLASSVTRSQSRTPPATIRNSGCAVGRAPSTCSRYHAGDRRCSLRPRCSHS